MALIVSVEVPVGVTGLTSKLELVALGTPLTLKFTGLEPLSAVTVTVVDAPKPPRVTVTELGDTERLKSDVEPPLEPTVNEPMAVLHK